MSNTEVAREPLVVGDTTYKVMEIVWPDDRRSFDVYRDCGSKGHTHLLTGKESLDAYPTEDNIRDLLDPADPDSFPTSSCGCGNDTVLTPEGWQHNVAPWFWGNDHDAEG